ncbi:response regulator [Microbacterium sp. NPDC055903]
MARSRWRIAIVEDHLLQRTLTERIVQSDPELAVVFSGETLPDFVRWWRRQSPATRPDLLLLDLVVDRGGFASPVLVERLVEEGLRVGVFSALNSPPLVRQMIQAGANGVIGKRDSEQQILVAIRSMLRGEEWTTPELAAVIAQDANRPQLSDQEERLLALYASGLALDAAAARIGVQPGTAKKYLQRIKEKYRAMGRPADTKLELRRAALADGLLPNR